MRMTIPNAEVSKTTMEKRGRGMRRPSQSHVGGGWCCKRGGLQRGRLTRLFARLAVSAIAIVGGLPIETTRSSSSCGGCACFRIRIGVGNIGVEGGFVTVIGRPGGAPLHGEGGLRLAASLNRGETEMNIEKCLLSKSRGGSRRSLG